MDVTDFNKKAWDLAVAEKNRWTVPVGPEVIANARKGKWELVLTPSKPVPMDWFSVGAVNGKSGLLHGVKLLALASGGGQQAPIFAAAGADVTVFDNSPAQLAQDRLVAEREGLKIETVEGDMKDLSVFKNETFDFIFHPCSNGFVPDILPVWKEAFRVLKKGGVMISGFVHPLSYLVDPVLEKKGIAQIRFKAPFSDLTSVTEKERIEYFGENCPLSFGHTLTDQIGGQLAAGFHLTGFFEDSWGPETPDPGVLNAFMDTFAATRALKP